MNWDRLLLLSLWTAPHFLLFVVAIATYRRQLYRQYPFFLLYTIYESATFALLYTLNFMPSVTAKQYAYAFMTTLGISIALRFGVIKEISEELFMAHPTLQATTRNSLRWLKALLALIGIACAAYAPGQNGTWLIGGLIVVSRGVAIIQGGLLLFLLSFSHFLGLSRHGYAFGISLGMGVLASIDLVTSAIRAQVVGQLWATVLNLVTTSGYLICSLIWLVYILAPERRPSHPVAVPAAELDDWTNDLRRLLRP